MTGAGTVVRRGRAAAERERITVGRLNLLGRDEWTKAEKCFRLSVVCLVVSAVAAVFLLVARQYLDEVKFLDPMGVALQLQVSYYVIAAWGILLGISWLARSAWPHNFLLGHACIQLYAVSNGFFSYMMGPFTNPYATICMLGGAAVGIPLLGRIPVLLGLASFSAVLLGTSIASEAGLIPYAPLMRAAPYVGQQLDSAWFYGLGLFVVGSVWMIFWTYFRVLARWQRREGRLRKAHREMESLAEQLERAKLQLEQRFSERTAELEHANSEILRGSAERGRISLELRSLTAAMESAVEGIARVDEYGRLQSLNSSFEAMHGLENEDLAGTEANLLIHPADQAVVERAVESVRRLGKVECEVRARGCDGELFYEQLVMVDDPSGGGGAHYRFARDVSAQREMQEQLIQAQKMDALGRLAGGIAHDFNNILTSMLLTTEQLRRQLGASTAESRSLAYVDWLIDAAEKASGLTGQLLDFSRMGTREETPIRVNEAISKLVKMLESTLDVDISMVCTLDETDPVIYGDPSRFETGLMNLALNARDAMPEGGVVTFRVQSVVLGAGDPLLGAFGLKPGEFVRIDVEDEGIGIQLDSNGKVFEPFYTTKPVGKGTGLGLSLVYTYMREIGGAIRVESGAEVGTVFSLFVPVTTPEIVEVKKPPAKEVPAGQGRILLAEDDESVSRPMETVLRNAGYEVWSCANGLEAVDLYRSQGTEIDLVVLDLRMPLLNGAEAFLEMRRIDPGVRAVIISGNAQIEDLRELNQRGLVGSLRKPFVERELLEFISGAMHG